MVLQRSWRRHRPTRHSDRVCVVTKRSYKVYADSDLESNENFRVLTVLNIGAGSSSVQQTTFSQEVEKYMKHGPLPNICDANNRPLPMIGKIKLPVKLGTFLVHDDFAVCESLAASDILGANFGIAL